jgi:hypothetical protein
LVAAKLQLIQQWWLPTFDILDGCTCNGNNPTKIAFLVSKGCAETPAFMVFAFGICISESYVTHAVSYLIRTLMIEGLPCPSNAYLHFYIPRTLH